MDIRKSELSRMLRNVKYWAYIIDTRLRNTRDWRLGATDNILN